MKVSLHKILESMVLLLEGQNIFFNKKTHERIYDNTDMDDVIYREGRLITEDEMLDEVEGNDDWVLMPIKWDIHDWDIMNRFCLSLEDDKLCDVCLDAIRGKGAFARFERFTNYYNLKKQWDDFQFKAYKKIAIKWCDEHDLEYIDDAEHL